MENVFLTSLTTPEVKQMFRDELVKFFANYQQPSPTLKEDNQTFSIAELACYLKVTKATIHTYKKRGIFKVYQTGRTVYFKKSEVDAALEVGKKKGANK